MYRRLKSEIYRLGWTMGEVADAIGISRAAWTKRYHQGKFLLEEAKKIKAVIKTDLSLEELFEV